MSSRINKNLLESFFFLTKQSIASRSGKIKTQNEFYRIEKKNGVEKRA